MSLLMWHSDTASNIRKANPAFSAGEIPEYETVLLAKTKKKGGLPIILTNLSDAPVITDVQRAIDDTKWTLHGAILIPVRTSERLTIAVETALPQLLAISEDAAKTREGHGKGWSRKQELGHLIDSATNNRGRFVVAALTGKYVGPSYDGNGWVDLGGYAHMPWIDLIELWERLNRALALLIENIPEARLSAPCQIGDGGEVTLEFIMEDYVSHMQTHLDHILA